MLTAVRSAADNNFSVDFKVEGEESIERLAAGLRDFLREMDQSARRSAAQDAEEKDRQRAAQESERQRQQAALRAKVDDLLEVVNCAAQDVDGVVDVIQGIAKHSSLLAVNATIEATNAGEAGDGFRVVASEVKSLADRTTEAAEDARTRISGIRNSTSQASEALDRWIGSDA